MDASAYTDIVPTILLFVDRRSFPDWRISRQTIDFHDLTFIAGGEAHYYVNGKHYAARTGDVIYIPPGSVREAHTTRKNPVHAYAFNFTLAPANERPLPFATVTTHDLAGPLLEEIKSFTLVWAMRQPGYEMQARALLMLILHRLLFGTTNGNRVTDMRIARARAYMADHYAEDLDLASVAAVAGLHPVYFSKLFKRETGYGFRQFLNVVRLNHAEMMLLSGDFTVSEVAERCGFRDVSYFSNLYKAMKGYPPSAHLRHSL